MTEVKPGDLIRSIAEYLPSGVTIEMEGKVSAAYESTAVLEGGFLAWIEDHWTSTGYIQVAVEILPEPIDFLPLRPGDVIQCASTAYSIVGDKVFYTFSGAQPAMVDTVKAFTPWLEDWHRQNRQRVLQGKGAQLLFRLGSS